MDPDVTLQVLRRLVEQIESEDANLQQAAYDLAEQFGYLDRWLSKGGFLPSDWRREGVTESNIVTESDLATIEYREGGRTHVAYVPPF